MLGPILLPSRLVLRALDDLHTIADAAGKLADVAPDVRRLAAVGDDVRRIAITAESIPEIEERLTQRLAMLDSSLTEALGVARDLNLAAKDIVQVTEALSEVAAALPAIHDLSISAERIGAATEPLQGAAERLGRIVDRLPGARPARSAAR